MQYRLKSQGFALPTIVIASVVLFAVLVAAIGSVASTTASLGTQYYEGLAADAAESGSVQANNCLKDNGYVSPWGAKTLTPSTDCSGNTVSGQSPTVLATPNYSSTYTVSPVTNSATGSQTATITGTVSLLVASTGATWQTYTKTLIIKTGGQIGTSQVVFGYSGGQGAFFGTVGADGTMRTVGYNGQGQLGNGSWGNTLAPAQFQVPSTSRIVAGFSNFLSGGIRMYALDSNGNAYGSGANINGSLGIGVSPAVQTLVNSPQQVQIPGKQIRYIDVGTGVDYFITTDNNVYAAGQCQFGQLGSNYTVPGCADQNTPIRVNLPTPDTSQPNTIPTNNMVFDRYDVYLRMAGGAVYGWGDNDWAMLGGDSFGTQSTPKLIGNYGTTGNPAATQVATDGASLYVLDSNGAVNSIGLNGYGQMGNTTMSLVMSNSSYNCMNNTSSDGVSLGLLTCNGGTAQKFQVRSDNTLYNAAKNVCVTANSDKVTLKLAACVASAANQAFVYHADSGTFTNAYSAKCIDNNAGDGIHLQLYTCNGTTSQYFLGYNGNLTTFDTSGFTGTITKMWTDQGSLSVLTSNGEVWSAGLNSKGQFGNGTTGLWCPVPVKFNMPVTATDIYETLSGSTTDPYQNLYAVGSDGKVYGAGANAFGQLGNNTVSAYSATPVAMSVIDGTNIVASQVQSGYGTTVIFTNNGSVYTVGNNATGQLGDGTTTNSSIPIKAKYVNNLKATTF